MSADRLADDSSAPDDERSSLIEQLLLDPNATPGTAYKWMAIAGLVTYGIAGLVAMFLLGILGGGMFGLMLGGLAPYCLLGAVIVPLVSVLGLMINAGLAHVAASAMGGTGTYDELAYAYATFQAPLALITAVLSVIPCVQYVSYAIGLYILVLNVLAVQAVHKFGAGKAIVSAVVMPIALAAGLACFVFVVL